MTAVFLPLVVVVSLDSRDQSGELSLVGFLDFSEGNGGGGLLMDDGTETSLTLDNAVGDTHLAAESGQEDDQFNGVNVVGDSDELSLLAFDQGNNVVKTVLDNDGLVGLHGLLAFSLGGSSSAETLTLLSLGLGAVLVGELEELSSSVLVQGLGELVNGRGNLQALVEDLLLALKTDVVGPLDEAGDIALGLDVLANTKVLGTLLNERVLRSLGGLLSLERVGCRCDLLASRLLGRCLQETDSSKRINFMLPRRHRPQCCPNV